MDKDTFLQTIADIGSCEDIADVRARLINLSDEVSKVYDEIGTRDTTIESLNQKIAKNNEDMDKLREYNNELFKRVGVQRTEKDQEEAATGKKEPEKRKFEDLFKEEGGDK